MTETDGAEQLNRFVADIDASNEIGRALKQAKNHNIPEDSNATARATVATRGYEHYNHLTPVDTPGRHTSFNPNDAADYRIAEGWANEHIVARDKRATSTLRQHLGPMALSLKRKQLEELLGDEKVARIIGENANEDYAEWANFYKVAARDNLLVQKAKAGQLSKEERAHLINGIVEDRAQFAVEQLKKDNIKDPLYHAEISGLVAATASAEHESGEGLYEKSAEILAKKSSDALRDYEGGKGKNLNTYVTSALNKLAQTDEGFENARRIMYGAAKIEAND
ncbi:MAG: hypothetical protein AABX12_04045 [Nanoarchaeota archaeon]